MVPTPTDETLRARRVAGGLLSAAVLVCLVPVFAFDAPWAQEGGPGFLAPDRHRAFLANVQIGLWWAGALDAALGLALIATRRWWIRDASIASASPALRLSRRQVALVLAAVLLALGLRLPLASRSLWWDEGWTIRQVLVGMYVGSGDDLHWSAGGLQRALWYAKKPTNHALYSVAAWGTHGAWRAANPGPLHRLDELAYRLPALLATALSVVLIALLAWQLGYAGAAPLAAFWLAIHPWCMRYGTEGRAYPFVILFALVVALGLARWLRGHRWRDLGMYALGLALLLWTWSYAAFLAAGLGAVALLGLALARGLDGQRIALGSRLVVASLLAGMFVLLVFAPNLTLAHLWDYEGRVARVLPRVLAGLATGMAWSVEAPERLPAAALPSVVASATAGVLTLLVMPALVLAGALALARRGWVGAVIVAGWAAAGPLSLGVTAALARHFYPRFELFLLPLVVLAASVGVHVLAARLARDRPRLRAALPWLVLLAYQVVVWPQTRVLLTHPYAPLRDVALRVSYDPETLRVGTGFGAGMVKIYDPDIRFAGTPEEILAGCREAQNAGRPFRAFYGYPWKNRGRDAGPALLETDAFVLVEELQGIEADFRYRVFEPARGACEPPS